MFEQYPDVLTIKEVAQILRIGRHSAYGLINGNVISSRRVGRKIIVPKKNVLDFLEKICYNENVTAGNLTVKD